MSAPSSPDAKSQNEYYLQLKTHSFRAKHTVTYLLNLESTTLIKETLCFWPWTELYPPE